MRPTTHLGRCLSQRIRLYSVAIVGSGPSGCYTAKYLPSSYRIDIFERLPTPYGLVRYGVAPDHPEVKNVQNDFDQLQEKTRLWANVTVGRDVSVDELRDMYDAVVLAYGCESDRKLGIPGESLAGVLSAREFVAWYNGHPDFGHIGPIVRRALPSPAQNSVVVIGHGNVALDCARILAKGSPGLMETDISSRALPIIGNGVSHVSIVGRRGHVQAAFTIKEVRELAKLEAEGYDTFFRVRQDELEMGLTDASQAEIKSSRPRSRIQKLLQESASNSDGKGNLFRSHASHQTSSESRTMPKTVDLRFLLNPMEFVASDDGQMALSAVTCERTRLEGEVGNQGAVGTGERETIPANLALVSIGYHGMPLPGVEQWFDHRRGFLQNDHGLVDPANDTQGALLTAGWLKRGPSGIIGTNIPDAKETAAAIVSAFDGRPPKTNDDKLLALLETRQVRTIDWKGYCKIEQKELEMRRHENQPREKLVSTDEMLKVALSSGS